MENRPAFHDADKIGSLIHPDVSTIAAQAVRARLDQETITRSAQHSPAGLKKPKIHLLIVDMQVDFCHPDGALYVPGAQDDLKRLIRFIDHQSEHISCITCSLDSHLPFQIFHPAWWVNRAGEHPAPFTIITCADVIDHKWIALFEPEWSAEYTLRLSRHTHKELTIWPYHCLIGSAGQSLDAELMSTILRHSFSTNRQPAWWIKGNIPQTEHYSIIQPEIPVPEQSLNSPDRELFSLFADSEFVFIAGEAKSHCVLETIEDLVERYQGKPDILQRIYVLEDCTSSIRHPEIDYETIAQNRFADFARKGVHFTRSTDPLPELPGSGDKMSKKPAGL